MAAVMGFHAHAPALGGSAAATASSGAASAGSTSAATGSSSTSTAATTSGSTKSVTGDAIATRYGPAQVRVTISGGKISEVEAVQLQNSDPKSVQISSYAAPLLRQSALTKQSGAIDAVSGATYTSASYEASLQSALDKAGFKAADGSRGTSQVP
jgi:uncharacterized protein with FMN-binding domain